MAEAVVRRLSSKQVFLNISQISQESTCVGGRPAALLKRDSNIVVFLWNLRDVCEKLYH